MSQITLTGLPPEIVKVLKENDAALISQTEYAKLTTLLSKILPPEHFAELTNSIDMSICPINITGMDDDAPSKSSMPTPQSPTIH